MREDANMCRWIVFLLACPLIAQTAHYGHDGKFALPDPKVTPGAINTACVADLSQKQHIVNGIEENICAKDFRTGPIRATIHNFAKMKRTACAAYGVKKCDGSVEGDHFKPIEVCGCPDCQTNIWPQPLKEARIKDHQVEDILPKLVCSGEMTLKQAQDCVATDWVKCAAKIKGMK